MQRKYSFKRSNLAIPYGLFLILFVILPLLLIIYYAFTDASGHLTIIDSSNNFVLFNNFINFFKDTSKLSTLFVSIVIGAINTILCLLLGYPIAYLLTRSHLSKNKVLVILFLMPMWINFVLRTAATRDLLTVIGLNGGNYPLVCVIIGMVYNYLPFMILPLYSTMLKMDHSLIDAASDLGAKPFYQFTRAIIPMSMPGIISGVTMVFMPTMSSYVIADVLGERKIQLLGNLIDLYFNQSMWNNGSTIAFIMLIILLISVLVTKGKNVENGGHTL